MKKQRIGRAVSGNYYERLSGKGAQYEKRVEKAAGVGVGGGQPIMHC